MRDKYSQIDELAKSSLEKLGLTEFNHEYFTFYTLILIQQNLSFKEVVKYSVKKILNTNPLLDITDLESSPSDILLQDNLSPFGWVVNNQELREKLDFKSLILYVIFIISCLCSDIRLIGINKDIVKLIKEVAHEDKKEKANEDKKEKDEKTNIEIVFNKLRYKYIERD